MTKARQNVESDLAAYPTVVCFGELLWDFLPHGRFVGGAPGNVAFHLRQLGHSPKIISAVGFDALGDDLLDRLDGMGLDTTLIARDLQRPTGTVRATLGLNGETSYVFAPNVAWDWIEIRPAALEAVRHARAFVFGSLAQRSPANQRSLDQLLDVLPRTAERVFDVNLRPPFDDLELVCRRARQATLLKLNRDEAARLASGEATDEARARLLACEFGCASVCITAGESGAGLLSHDHWHEEAGRKVTVADTIGAGDAFLAGLLGARLTDRTALEALRAGCRLGEWVASQPGATPPHRLQAEPAVLPLIPPKFIA